MLQSMSADGAALRIPRMTIEDEPSRSLRVLMIDIKNRWHPVADLKQFVDRYLVDLCCSRLAQLCMEGPWKGDLAGDSMLAGGGRGGGAGGGGMDDDDYHDDGQDVAGISRGRRVLACVVGSQQQPSLFAVVNDYGEVLDHLRLDNIKNRARAGNDRDSR